jgi:hypothetical protein
MAPSESAPQEHSNESYRDLCLNQRNLGNTRTGSYHRPTNHRVVSWNRSRTNVIIHGSLHLSNGSVNHGSLYLVSMREQVKDIVLLLGIFRRGCPCALLLPRGCPAPLFSKNLHWSFMLPAPSGAT